MFCLRYQSCFYKCLSMLLWVVIISVALSINVALRYQCYCKTLLTLVLFVLSGAVQGVCCVVFVQSRVHWSCESVLLCSTCEPSHGFCFFHFHFYKFVSSICVASYLLFFLSSSSVISTCKLVIFATTSCKLIIPCYYFYIKLLIFWLYFYLSPKNRVNLATQGVIRVAYLLTP